MHRFHVCLAMAALTVVVGATGAAAQGFGIYEQGACAMGRAGATVAAPCPDGSSVFFNPAGIAVVKGQQISFGGTLIRPGGDFTNSQTQRVSALNTLNYPVPNVYYVANVHERIAAGVGLFAPYGLTTDWPEASEGRFLGYKSLVHGIYVQPTVAFRVNEKVSVGVGIDITRLNVELRQRVDLSPVPLTGTPFTFANLGIVPGTDFADVQLKGHAWHAGYHLGLHVTANERVSFGARYLSGQKVDVTNGRVATKQVLTGRTLPIPLSPTLPAGTPIDLMVAPQFGAGGNLSAQGAKTAIPLPDQFVAGVAIQAAPKVRVFVDYQFVNWSMFDALVIDQDIAPTRTIVESYGDTHGIRLGTEYALTTTSALRAGLVKHGVGAPDQTVTPNLPEGPRWEVAAGYGTRLGSRFRADFAYQYLHQAERAGRTTDGGLAVPTAALNNGVFRFRAHLVGITLGVEF